ncbi:MAG: alkaline phosphatase family protein [Gemmatimonadales bacterium]
MTRHVRPLLTLLVAGAAACGGSPSSAAPPGGPSLVVLVVVDQLTPDLLDRYGSFFRGGLRRLLDQGLRFENATHDHANTVTAAGHTTLGTGVYPVRHGIVGNEWLEQVNGEWKQVYSMSDSASPIVGHPELEGMGPRNIERAGLASWIAARDPDARIVSISKKERAAIGMAAQARGDVYWIPEDEDEFVTSTAYATEYPEWVVRFNEREMPGLYSDTVWESRVPASAAAASRPDTSRWEFDREHTAFPHQARDHADMTNPYDVNLWRWDYTPFPDRAVVSFALEAVRALDLGRRGAVDFLAVSLSQTDRIGHTFGPGSREQLDNLLRLDAEVGRLLEGLDDRVGRGRWVLAFSSDHGVLEIPEHLADEGILAGRISREQRLEVAARVQAAAAGGPWAVREAVASLPFVAGAYTFEEIERDQPADSFAVLYAHSHSRTRLVGPAARAGVYLRYPPNFLAVASITTHGTPYYYDRHVPLIFFGPGVRAGTSAERVATVDVAPTLARLGGITAPDDLDGHVIQALDTP